MAIKNTASKNYNVDFETICDVLRNPDYSTCLDATYIEEAILSDGVEFRYVRKTNLLKRINDYGRNFFIKITKESEKITNVAITTQSRKVTVLVDTNWKQEVDKAFSVIDILLRR